MVVVDVSRGCEDSGGRGEPESCRPHDQPGTWRFFGSMMRRSGLGQESDLDTAGVEPFQRVTKPQDAGQSAPWTICTSGTALPHPATPSLLSSSSPHSSSTPLPHPLLHPLLHALLHALFSFPTSKAGSTATSGGSTTMGSGGALTCAYVVLLAVNAWFRK